MLPTGRQTEKGDRSKRPCAVEQNKGKKWLICFPFDKVADQSQQDLASEHSFEDRSMVGDS